MEAASYSLLCDLEEAASTLEASPQSLRWEGGQLEFQDYEDKQGTPGSCLHAEHRHSQRSIESNTLDFSFIQVLLTHCPGCSILLPTPFRKLQ